jgi:hypothetical protein
MVDVRLLCIFALVISLAIAQTHAPAPKSAPAKRPAGSSQPSSPPSRKSPAPDPDEGSVDGNVYTSDFFRFQYTLPEGFNVDEDFLADLQDESNSTFVLMAAQGPLSGEDRRDMVVIMADREATTAEAYVQKVTRDYAQKQQFEVVKPAYPVTVAGKPFYRADFRKEGTYQTAVFTVLKGYAVGFSIAAPSEETMNPLVESLNSVKFLGAATPKQSPGTKPPAGEPSTPMKAPAPKR